MPFFSKFKSKGSQPTPKPSALGNNSTLAPVKPKWQSTWTSAQVVPAEVEELIHACTTEMKLRAEALDSPFLLLPFRPGTDPSSARTFIGNFFTANASGSLQYRGANLEQELRLTDPTVLCSILKWCWSRMPNGVVGWPLYESFRMGEKEARMARNAFQTFVPIAADSLARKNIIFDFYDLMAAVAAHGKSNGLGGRKLSRLAGWWAFSHTDDGKGFEGGYKSWSAAADASSHLFFAYLRSQSPDTDPSMNVIERIPRSLQALLAQTEYPPETPALLQRSTPRVVMIVDTVSPTPFALLRRAKHFEYRDNDLVLHAYSEFDDPVDALTDECKRVLYAIATTNSSASVTSRHGEISKPDEAWSAFTSLGFSDMSETTTRPPSGASNGAINGGMRSTPRSRNANFGRPTTPSWGDFLSSGFEESGHKSPSTMLLSPDKILPPLGSRAQTPHGRGEGDDDLAPGELAAIANVDLDDAFWWVWMTSLAGEEPKDRKAVFGRCALIETMIMNGHWLIMEEQVKGASPDPIEGAQILEKKSRFGFTKRSRLGRKTTTKKSSPIPDQDTRQNDLGSQRKASINPEQEAKIKAAAAALASKRDGSDGQASRRGRLDDATSMKTNSVMTLGLTAEAGPAMKWTNAYDKSAIRAAYLGDSFAGRGMSKENLMASASSVNLNDESATTQNPPMLSPEATSFMGNATNRDLPALPAEEKPDLNPEPPREPTPEPIEEPEPAPLPVEPIAAIPQLHERDEIQHEAEDVPLPEANNDDAVTPLEKEVGGTVTPESPRLGKVERKPVPRANNIQDHPAFRQQSTEESRPAEQTAALGAATIAARKAVQSSGSTSPEEPRGSKLKKQPGGGGLKQLFSRKKDNPNRRSMDVRNPASNTLAPPSDSNLSRKFSLMRKKPASTSPPKEPEIINIREASFDASPEPTEPALHDQFDDSTVDMSRVHTQDSHDAGHAFSRFDQGPMDDMPAHPPRDSIDSEEAEYSTRPMETHSEPRYDDHEDAIPEPQHYTHQVSATPSDSFATPMERLDPAEDTQSEASMDHDPAEHIMTQDSSKDRWERIRENAARRAARASEEQSRPSQSYRTDDGETSGEETIESRVARIKARVAELTGNMDGAGAAPLRR